MISSVLFLMWPHRVWAVLISCRVWLCQTQMKTPRERFGVILLFHHQKQQKAGFFMCAMCDRGTVYTCCACCLHISVCVCDWHCGIKWPAELTGLVWSHTGRWLILISLNLTEVLCTTFLLNALDLIFIWYSPKEDARDYCRQNYCRNLWQG